MTRVHKLCFVFIHTMVTWTEKEYIFKVILVFLCVCVFVVVSPDHSHNSVLYLFQNNWVPRRGDQGPKTIDQIHKDAELEEHREQMKVQQALISKKESSGGSGGRMGGGRRGPHSPGRRGPHSPGRRGTHSPGRGASPQDDGWNTVPISKNRPIDTSRLSKITKVREGGGFFSHTM